MDGREEEEKEEDEGDRRWPPGGHLSCLLRPSRAASAVLNERGVKFATTVGGRERELTPEEDTEDE